eukprot:CAMPEP_0119518002 /NCGR_PEP_ID=MMETSP1344-20130328/34741_1 /TAXON_ID=236787 /ORGANISM="Florenciella parvula, Strain CCMP2471" /LENGTH=60 /DNA_ID=CAMNT_0007555647 /DNA_START=30 /DNA_END=209 /DNA_ORIENTATION=+
MSGRGVSASIGHCAFSTAERDDRRGQAWRGVDGVAQRVHSTGRAQRAPGTPKCEETFALP